MSVNESSRRRKKRWTNSSPLKLPKKDFEQGETQLVVAGAPDLPFEAPPTPESNLRWYLFYTFFTLVLAWGLFDLGSDVSFLVTKINGPEYINALVAKQGLEAGTKAQQLSFNIGLALFLFNSCFMAVSKYWLFTRTTRIMHANLERTRTWETIISTRELQIGFCVFIFEDVPELILSLNVVVAIYGEDYASKLSGIETVQIFTSIIRASVF